MADDISDDQAPKRNAAGGVPAVDPVLLPSPRRLARAAIAAVAMAIFLAFGVVLPAETGRDPIGVGAWLGLTEMGRIKVALAAEQRADSMPLAIDDSSSAAATAASAAHGDASERSLIVALDTTHVWRDSASFTLQPNEGIEFKLAMQRAQYAFFEWATDSTQVSFNLHGDPGVVGEEEHTYRRGNSSRERGDVVAVFDGLHGWFWRNRSTVPVSIRLWTGGEYLELREIP